MKLSIVTPTKNSIRFIGETIRSVISQQGDFDIEYIVVDYCSTDGTVALVEKYIRDLENGIIGFNCRRVTMKLLSVDFPGMYRAINCGFQDASGDIFAYINSDDVYLPGAFAAVEEIFTSCEEVHWIKGVTSYIDEQSRVYEHGRCYLYDNNLIGCGVYGHRLHFIQQDSVFWRSWLWKSVGGVAEELNLAGDYYLWINFSNHAALHVFDREVSCFRRVEGQLSQQMEKYYCEAEDVRGRWCAGKTADRFLSLKKIGGPVLANFYYYCKFNCPPTYRVIEKRDHTLSVKIIEWHRLEQCVA
jgi:glycosyltransferase involved in cell wall biosynthesis